MAKRSQANFNIDPDLWERFKAKCLESGSNATGELVAFITRFVDGEETTDRTTAAIDPKAIERIIEGYLDKNLDRYLDRYATRNADREIATDIDKSDRGQAIEEKAIDPSGVSDRESETLPILDCLENTPPDEPEPAAPIVTVETYAICQCRDRAIVSFWTGGGWSEDFGAAKVYSKEGIAKTQVVRLQKAHPGIDIRYNSTERLREMIDRLRAA
jgi:hypothetical protein